VVMSSPDDKGEVTMPADIEGGEVRVRIDGSYLTEALRACGGMVDFKLTDGKSPVLFAVDGYQLVVMPMLTGEVKAGDKAEAKPEDTEATEPEADTAEGSENAEGEQAEVGEAEKAEAVAEAEAVVKAEKPKRSHKKKEKVAVA
jgi:DNA polymerase-3 subunit beta